MMLKQREETAVLTTEASSETPLPRLLSLDARKRQPPSVLREAVGPALAAFIYNYQQAGSIYRYLDMHANKVKTILSGVEANLFAMRYGKTYLSARTYRQKQSAELGTEKYIVAMDGEAHYKMRKLQKPGYARSILETRPEALIETVQQVIAAHPAGEPLPVYQFFQKVMTIQLGKTILNHESAHVWQEVCTYVDGMLAASFSPHPLSDEGLARYQAAAVATMALADEMIATHQSSPPTCPRPDLVDDLLAVAARDASLMSKQDLRIAVLTPYIAGINPVAHTCSYLLYALLTHPHILESVLAEVNHYFVQEGFSLKAVRQMEQLRYSIWEALRLYPFASVLQMTALQEFEFDGCRVKPGTAVVLATTVPHFLEKYYAEPFTFDIDRYRPHRAEHRQPGAFAAYGVGPHICLGAGFAEDQMLLTMAALLHNTSMQLAPDTGKPIVGIPSTNNFPVYIN